MATRWIKVSVKAVHGGYKYFYLITGLLNVNMVNN